MSGTNYIASNWRTPTNQNSSKNDNYGLSFDGTGYIDCGNDPQIQLTGDISISVWFKTTSTDTMVIAAKRYNTLGDAYGWQVYCSGGKLAFLVTRSGPTTTNFVGTTTISDGAWHHVLCTINQDSQIAVILDGSTEGTAPLPAGTFIDSNSDLRIGRGTSFAGPPYYFQGEISEVALFDYLVSGATLYGNATLGSGNPMALKPTPVGYWPLGDNSASDPLAQPNVAVEDASVFEFNGSNDYVDFGDNDSLSFGNGSTDSPFSFSAWVKLNLLSGNSTIVSKDLGGVLREYALFVLPTGKIRIFLKSQGGNNQQSIDSTTALLTGQWYHIACTYNGIGGNDAADGLTLYVNGSAETPTNVSKQAYVAMSNTTADFRIGKYSTGNLMKGSVSDVAVFNSELSEPNVEAIYNSGVPGDISSLNPLAWYKLDQSANWEADTAGDWQIPNAVSAYPQSFDFDSTVPNYIDCGTLPYFETDQTSFSISFWFNQNAVGGQAFSIGNRVYFIIQSNRIQCWNVGPTTGRADTTGDIYSVGTWFHFMCTYDGTGATDSDKFKVWINGVPNALNYIFPQPVSTLGTSLRTTIASNFNGTLGQSADIKMSNVAIWSTDESDEVSNIYNNGVPVTSYTNTPLAWYKLDQSANYSSFTNYWSVYNDKTSAPTPTFTNAIRYLTGYYNPPGIYGGIGFTNTAWSSSDITISAWLRYPKGFDGAYGLELLRNSQINCIFDSNTSGKRFRVGTATAYKGFLTNITDGLWHHYLVYIPNGATTNLNDIRLWQDGIELSGSNVGSSYSTPITNIIGIGSGNQSGGGIRSTFNVSNYALFDTDQTSNIDTIFNNGVPGDISSLNPSIWYKADSPNVDFLVPNNTSISFTDSSGNNNTGIGPIDTSAPTIEPYIETIDVVAREAGTSSGMTEQSLVNNNVSTLNGESSGMTSGNLVLSDLTRNLPYQNYSLQFDGGLDEILLSSSFVAAGEFTLSLWIKPTVLDSNQNILGNGTSSQNWINPSSATTIRVKPAGTLLNFLETGGNNLTVGSWNHILIYRDSSNDIGIFVNGSPFSTPQNNSDILTLQTIGRGVNKWFSGNINEVAFWDTNLSSTEVLKLYANGIPQDLTNFTPQPVSWWTLGKETFWDGADWIIRDMIGTNDAVSANMGGDELKGDAPRSQANGVGTNIAVPTNLKGEAGWSDKNGYSINMSSTARTTDTP